MNKQFQYKLNNKYSVLIVEDDMIISLYFKQLIENWGFIVQDRVKSGKEAVIRVMEGKPDIVLMNYNIQGPMNGVDVALKIWQYRNIPIIFISGIPDIWNVIKMNGMKFCDSISKPVDMNVLYKKIQKLLNNDTIKEDEGIYQNQYMITTKNL